MTHAEKVRVQVLTATATSQTPDGEVVHTLAYPSRGRRPLAMAMTAVLMSTQAGVWEFTVGPQVEMGTALFRQMREAFPAQLAEVAPQVAADAEFAALLGQG